FRNGVTASLDFIGVTAADKTKYLASKAVPQNAQALTLSHIMIQKYIALYAMNSLETWNDMRRYNYSTDVYQGFSFPSTLFVDNNRLPAQRVRPRFNSEYVWNRDALAKIGADLPTYHTKPVWFTEK
ncbi:MAG: SusD/RagB family nutrient-binding outer membrane lipoprotein, partial [Saprospiraceae bacterium]